MANLKTLTVAALLAFVSAPVAAVAEADMAALPASASGKAHAQLRKADLKDGKLTVELRFLTDYAGYSGEEIYADAAKADIHVEADGKSFPLAKDDAGKPMAPAQLMLKFNYDPGKNPRVGTWKGTFDAPPAGRETATLVMPNFAPVSLKIKNR